MSEKINRDSWATPMPVYMALDAEFDFAADLCASDSNAKHPLYVTEQDDALSNWWEKLGGLTGSGGYVWVNPPYSNIKPWVSVASELQHNGIGSVMLVMADSSVGWYYDALQHCNEIREVIKGRLAFINPETGQPVGGNNKGSVFLIFDPYGRSGAPRRTYVERDQLMIDGADLMVNPELSFAVGSVCAAD